MIKSKIRHIHLLEIIHKNPGLNFCDIMRITGLKNGTVSHNIGKLEQMNEVTVVRKLKNTRFFPLTTNPQELILLEMLRRPTPYAIISVLEKFPEGLILSKIAEHVQKSTSTISTYLQMLLLKQIIIVRRRNNQKIFVLNDVIELRQTIQKYNFKPLSKTIQNFNNMFESL